MGDESITRPYSIHTKEKKNFDFQLYNSFQPGLYEYDIWLNKIDSGTVYIKAYEITQNDRLSEEKLKERTSLRVNNETDALKIFETKIILQYMKVTGVSRMQRDLKFGISLTMVKKENLPKKIISLKDGNVDMKHYLQLTSIKYS